MARAVEIFAHAGVDAAQLDPRAREQAGEPAEVRLVVALSTAVTSFDALRGQAARDHQALDLARALYDAHHARLAVDRFDGAVLA